MAQELRKWTKAVPTPLPPPLENTTDPPATLRRSLAVGRVVPLRHDEVDRVGVILPEVAVVHGGRVARVAVLVVLVAPRPDVPAIRGAAEVVLAREDLLIEPGSQVRCTLADKGALMIARTPLLLLVPRSQG